MGNTLTSMVPDLYQALDIVSREQSGFLRAVTHDASSARAAVNQSIRVPIAPASTASDITAANVVPDDGDQVISNVEVTISKARRVPFRWTGEEELGVSHGAGGGNIRTGQIVQAMRTLCNEAEAGIASLHSSVSRAAGAAGTTPFASNLSEAADVRQILSDNGASMEDLQLVVSTGAGTKLRSLAQLTDANRAGSAEALRRGLLLDILGFQTRESAQVKSHTKGSGSSATTDNVGYAVGATTITLASAGTGTILAGDVVTFAGDTNKYLVTSGDADVSNGGTITLAEPGLKVAIAASATAVTVGNSYTANLAFDRSAIVLVTRAPALPDGGDLASDRLLIEDSSSGLAFEVAMYPEYRRMHYEVALCWGYSCIKPEHAAILLG